MPFYTHIHRDLPERGQLIGIVDIRWHAHGAKQDDRYDLTVIRMEMWRGGQSRMRFFCAELVGYSWPGSDAADVLSLAQEVRRLEAECHKLAWQHQVESGGAALDALADAVLAEGGPSVDIGTALAETRRRQGLNDLPQ